MISEKSRQRLLEQIHIETKQLLNATVLCRDINSPSEIFEAMQKCTTSKKGLVNYVKYAHMMIAVLGYTCSKATNNKIVGKIFISYNTDLINKAVLASHSIRDLLNEIADILNDAIDDVTSMVKEDIDDGTNKS